MKHILVPMLTKKELKDIQSLDHKKFRDALGCFIAEGPKIVGELVQIIPDKIQKIYAVSAWAQQYESLKKLVQVVNESELQQIAQTKTPNRVLAVLQQW